MRIIKGGAEGLTDDAQKMRLTIIGTEAECRQVLGDLDRHPALAGWKDQLVVQAYRPDAWAVKNVGLPVKGHPVIILQTAPDSHWLGKVVHAQVDYHDGPEGLAGALRTADPNYRPDRDPDLRKRLPRLPEPKEPKEPDERKEPEKVSNRSHYVVIGAFVLIVLALCLGKNSNKRS